MDAAPSDEKGLFLTVKSEVIDTDMKSDISNFGVMLESPVQAFVNPSLLPAPLVPSGLQRYHSAPSSFLHSLNDDAFLQVSSPLDSSSNSRTSNSFIAPFFPEGLTAIIEQMENEKLGTSSTDLNEEFDPYMDAARHEYGKRAALSAAMLQTGKPDTNWQVPTEAFIPGTLPHPSPFLFHPAGDAIPCVMSATFFWWLRFPIGRALADPPSPQSPFFWTCSGKSVCHFTWEASCLWMVITERYYSAVMCRKLTQVASHAH